jgi:branched-subunit amino acid ABC-type transport system permease component
MQGFLRQLLSGVADGGIYASLALALVMIYQATHHVNFAQGAMAMFSTYIAWAMIDAGFPYWGCCSSSTVWPGGFPAAQSRAFRARSRQARGTAASICHRTRWV